MASISAESVVLGSAGQYSCKNIGASRVYYTDLSVADFAGSKTTLEAICSDKYIDPGETIQFVTRRQFVCATGNTSTLRLIEGGQLLNSIVPKQMPTSGAIYQANLDASDYTTAAKISFGATCRNILIYPDSGCSTLHIRIGSAPTANSPNLADTDVWARAVDGVDGVYVLADSASGTFNVEAW
jgi:hypothetical protein